MIDPFSGTQTAFYAAARMGVRLVSIDSQIGGMISAAADRNRQLWAFLRGQDLICKVGEKPKNPEWYHN